MKHISSDSPTGNSLVSTTNLELAYNMEILDTGKMNDFSTNGNDGTIVAGATDTAGRKGQARAFNGIAGEIQFDDNASVSIISDFTFSVWVNVTDHLTTHVLFSKFTAASGVNGYGSFIDTDGKISD